MTDAEDIRRALNKVMTLHEPITLQAIYERFRERVELDSEDWERSSGANKNNPKWQSRLRMAIFASTKRQEIKRIDRGVFVRVARIRIRARVAPENLQLTRLEFFAGMALCGTAGSGNAFDEKMTADNALAIAKEMVRALEEER